MFKVQGHSDGGGYGAGGGGRARMQAELWQGRCQVKHGRGLPPSV